MVVVDRFTKMAHFIAVEQNAMAKDVADVFLRDVQSLVISVRETARLTKLPRQNALSALLIFKQPK